MCLGELLRYDYQVKWRFSSAENVMWVDREKLLVGALLVFVCSCIVKSRA
jgi:hypothetical protein